MINIIKKYLNLSYKNISEEIINYLMDDVLNGNSNNYSDNELITLIKAFCYRQVYEFSPEYDIEVLPSKELDNLSKFKNTMGLTTKDKIYLNKEELLKIRNKEVDILRTVFHETTHVQQKNLINNNEISYKAYLLIMEQIIINETDIKYKKDNYYYFYEEIDARTQAESKLFDYLNIHNNKLLDENIKEMLERIIECKEDGLVLLRKLKNKKYDREELFDRIMLKHPEYREGYPLLEFFYNKDGSKIVLGEIIKRDREVNDTEFSIMAHKLKILDNYVITNRRGSKKNLQKDLLSLLSIGLVNADEIYIVSEALNRIDKIINENDDSDSLNELYNSLIVNINRIKIKIESCKHLAYQYSYMLNI